ncbi:hypothetical protein GJ744_000153 [Endocarpon pusillum]|uniref:Uncharacterized protein n=1 Tax=Endocarpon pusillum TaxID=364733 RepID=A0A8H7ASH0_9EURO|nr:hypothetical protein GJ744_000153 [Endocarpon pusillum]
MSRISELRFAHHFGFKVLPKAETKEMAWSVLMVCAHPIIPEHIRSFRTHDTITTFFIMLPDLASA